MKQVIRQAVKNITVSAAQTTAIVTTLREFLTPFNTIGVYYPLANEVDIRELFAMTRDFYLVAMHNGLEYRKLQTPLVPNRLGILESHGPVISNDNLDVIIIPCQAANRNGYRIGFGAGYFDNFLKDYHGITVGVLTEAQIYDFTPDPWDIPLNYLITEQGLYQVPRKD